MGVTMQESGSHTKVAGDSLEEVHLKELSVGLKPALHTGMQSLPEVTVLPLMFLHPLACLSATCGMEQGSGAQVKVAGVNWPWLHTKEGVEGEKPSAQVAVQRAPLSTLFPSLHGCLVFLMPEGASQGSSWQLQKAGVIVPAEHFCSSTEGE